MFHIKHKGYPAISCNHYFLKLLRLSSPFLEIPSYISDQSKNSWREQVQTWIWDHNVRRACVLRGNNECTVVNFCCLCCLKEKLVLFPCSRHLNSLICVSRFLASFSSLRELISHTSVEEVAWRFRINQSVPFKFNFNLKCKKSLSWYYFPHHVVYLTALPTHKIWWKTAEKQGTECLRCFLAYFNEQTKTYFSSVARAKAVSNIRSPQRSLIFLTFGSWYARFHNAWNCNVLCSDVLKHIESKEWNVLLLK